MRDMVFISHANPEDNEFALWLALQLAAHGYPVWCDLTKLLGGEAFWTDIEDAVRKRTSKFIYVLSRTSNTKPGPRDELHLAKTVQRADSLKDFVIPVVIDDLPPREFNVQIAGVTAVDGQVWAKALAQLLEKFDQDGVPRREGFSPGAVASWWREHWRADAGVRHEPEMLLSNFLPLSETPTLYFHELSRADLGRVEIPSKLPLPGVQHGIYLVSLAPASCFDGQLSPCFISSTTTRQMGEVGSHERPRLLRYGDEKMLLSRLLREAWLHMLADRGIAIYTYSNGGTTFYFKEGTVPSNTIVFDGTDGARGRRSVVGFRTMGTSNGAPVLRYWHFGLEAQAVHSPSTGFLMKAHVLFSNDGQTIWSNKDRLHRARRSQCKQWWNDEWRDRLLASLFWLSGGTPFIQLDLGGGRSLKVSSHPLDVLAPVTYGEDDVCLEQIDDVEEDEDDEELLETAAE